LHNVSFRIGWTALWLALSALAPALAAGASWDARPGQLGESVAAVAVTVSSPAAESPGTLELICYPSHNVGLYLELEINVAAALSDVDFNDYEGPDAPYNRERLARLTLDNDGRQTTITGTGAGWFTPVPGRFRLSLALDTLPGPERAQIHEALRHPLRALSLEMLRSADGAGAMALRTPGEDAGLLRAVSERCEKTFIPGKLLPRP